LCNLYAELEEVRKRKDDVHLFLFPRTIPGIERKKSQWEEKRIILSYALNRGREGGEKKKEGCERKNLPHKGGAT